MSTADKIPEPTLAVVGVGDIITREGWNPRSEDDQADADALAASVRAQGLLQPLLVERAEAGTVLIDGHRRLVAARAAGLATVPVIYPKAVTTRRPSSRRRSPPTCAAAGSGRWRRRAR